MYNFPTIPLNLWILTNFKVPNSEHTRSFPPSFLPCLLPKNVLWFIAESAKRGQIYSDGRSTRSRRRLRSPLATTTFFAVLSFPTMRLLHSSSPIIKVPDLLCECFHIWHLHAIIMLSRPLIGIRWLQNFGEKQIWTLCVAWNILASDGRKNCAAGERNKSPKGDEKWVCWRASSPSPQIGRVIECAQERAGRK